MHIGIGFAALLAALLPASAYAGEAPTSYWCWAEIRAPGPNNIKVVTEVHDSRAFADSNDRGAWQNALNNQWLAKMNSRFGPDRIFSQMCSNDADVTHAAAVETQGAFVRTAKYYHYQLIVDDMN